MSTTTITPSTTTGANQKAIISKILVAIDGSDASMEAADSVKTGYDSGRVQYNSHSPATQDRSIRRCDSRTHKVTGASNKCIWSGSSKQTSCASDSELNSSIKDTGTFSSTATCNTIIQQLIQLKQHLDPGTDKLLDTQLNGALQVDTVVMRTEIYTGTSVVL
ncbi:MAG: hypothetical protein M3044_04665 [Thermoproteota archaeon]|nr:hypothetical protein [Thermoproteota archaeon]